MAKIDEVKERIMFLTRLLTIFIGIMVLVTSGLVGFYIKQNFSIIFWLGIIVMAIIIGFATIFLVKIESLFKKIGGL
jgi:hypothetical protein